MRYVVSLGIIASILLLPTVSAFNWGSYYYHEDDAKDDVVYFSMMKFGYYRGKQIPDIDLRSVDVTCSNENITITLEVEGSVRTEDEFNYFIEGNAWEYDLTPYDFTIMFEYGLTHLSYQKNHTVVNLTEGTSLSGGTLMIVVPSIHFPGNDIFEISATASKWDRNDMRSYIDSTEPIELIAEDEPSGLYGVFIVGLLLVGAFTLIYTVYGKKMRLWFKSHLKKKCQQCGVIYGKRVKRCVYCDIEL